MAHIKLLRACEEWPLRREDDRKSPPRSKLSLRKML